MSEWLVGAIYILGVLHAVPAWYFGKSAGIRYSIHVMTPPAGVERADDGRGGE